MAKNVRLELVTDWADSQWVVYLYVNGKLINRWFHGATPEEAIALASLWLDATRD
jgi:predicted RNase H-like HicB family nuclease